MSSLIDIVIGLLLLHCVENFFCTHKHKKNVMSLCLQCEHPDMYGILTKREVKVVGYWPGSYFCGPR